MMNLLLLLLILLILAIAATATTSSVPPHHEQQVIIVPISRVHLKGHHQGGPTSRYRNLITKTTHSVPLYNEQNYNYLVNVTLPDKRWYLLLLDTGSSDTWFRGQYCLTTDGSSCTGRNVSTVPLSPGLVDLQLSFVIIYGSDYVAGEVYKAAVAVGGVSSTIAMGVSFIEYDQLGIDGVLGMGYQGNGYISNQVTPFTHVPGNWFDEASFFQTKVFGVYLSSTSNGDKGEVTFGGYDATRYTGKVTWIPLVKFALKGLSYTPSFTTYGFYAFSIATWTWSIIADQALGVVGGKGDLFTTATDPYGPTNMTIADTGSFFITIPTTPSHEIGAALNLKYNVANQAYTVPCKNSLPPVNFHHGLSTTFSIPSSIYTFPLTSNECFFGIMGGGDGVATFGAAFTRAYYTMFDKAGHRIGYALAK
jgi:hypothetical protein